MPQVSVPVDSRSVEERVEAHPHPVFLDALTLSLIEGSDVVCRALAPIMSTLELSIQKVVWEEHDVSQAAALGLPEHGGTLKVYVDDVLGGQAWFDGCAALVSDLDAIEFKVDDNQGNPYATVRFNELTCASQKRKFDAEGEDVAQRLFQWNFKTVKESVLQQ